MIMKYLPGLRRVRLFSAAGAVCLAVALCAFAGDQPQKSAGPIYVISIEEGGAKSGMIDSVTANFVIKGIEAAKEAGAALVIVRLDTYGGELTSTNAIVSAIEDLRPVPTVAFVDRRAFSAGAFIATACEKIFMAKGGNLGAATPIVMGAQGPAELSPDIQEKIVSAFSSEFRALAEKHGRNGDVAAAMVDRSIELKRVVVDGKSRIVSAAGIEKLIRENDAKPEAQRSDIRIGETVLPKDKLLTMTSEQALDYGYIDGVVEDRAGMLKTLGYDSPAEERIVSLHTTWEHSLARSVMKFSLLLLTLAGLGLMLKIYNPGSAMGFIIFFSALGLFFWASHRADKAGALEIIIFLAGYGLFLLEILVIPGFGVAGALGIALMAASLFLSYLPNHGFSFDFERQPWNADVLNFALRQLVVMIAMLLAIGIVSVRYVQRIPLLRKFVLTGAIGATLPSDVAAETRIGESAQGAPLAVRVGDVGVAMTILRPAGTAEFGSRRVDVVSEGEYITEGTGVRVVGIDGRTVTVTKA